MKGLLSGGERGFYLVRHGQTAGNKNRYLGWSDEPLDETGQVQAQSVGQSLAAAGVDAIFASPFSRTQATARPLAERCGLTVHLRDALKELNFGDYQGLAKADHPLRIRFEFAERPVPGGESLRDVADRLAPFLAELRERVRAGERVVVVSHFWTSRVLLGTLRRLPLETMMSRLGYKPAVGSILAVACVCPAGADWEVADARALDTACRAEPCA